MHDYIVRNIQDNVYLKLIETVEGEGATSLPRGASGRFQSWNQALTNIGALSLDPSWSIPCFALWQYALAIARIQRGDLDLKSLDTIELSLQKEINELALVEKQDAQAVLYRLANVVYYAVQRYARDGQIHQFRTFVQAQCNTIGLPLTLVFDCAVAKFQIYSQSKNAEKEQVKASIAHIYHEFQQTPKFP